MRKPKYNRNPLKISLTGTALAPATTDFSKSKQTK